MNRSQKGLVSIIVPVYNVERYLKQCVESILNSTYTNFELILVNDGSTDGSTGICDNYAEKHERIKVIHKINCGVSQARNSGLDIAQGEYITFVDGDDVIHPNMLTVLVDSIEEGEYDVSMVYGYQVLETEIHRFIANKELGLLSSHKVISQGEMIRGLFGTSMSEFQYIVVWNKLYKRTLVQDLLFKNTGSEDLEWSLQMGLRMNKAVCVEERLYYWIQHQSSMTHQRINETQVDRINSYVLCLNHISQDMVEYRAWCLEKLYKVILHTRYNARNTRYSDKVKEMSRSIINSTIGEYLSCVKGFYKKYGLLIFYYIPYIYNRFMDKKAAQLKKSRPIEYGS